MSYRILIVEDDINFRYAIKEIVPWTQNGFEIAGEAIHGKQALQILEKEKIDIVITDMSMPLMNGIELTKEISKRYPEIQVVAFSAYDDFVFVKEAMKNGAKDYILKQELNPDTVITTLKNICKAKEQKKEKENTRELLQYYSTKWLAAGTAPDRQIKEYISNLLKNKTVMLLKIVMPQKEDIKLILDNNLEKILFRKYDEEGNLFLIWSLLETNSIRQQSEEQRRIISQIQNYCTATSRVLVSSIAKGIDAFTKLPDELVQLISLLPYVKDQVILYTDYANTLKKREADFQYSTDAKISFAMLERDNNPLKKMETALLQRLPDEDKLNEAYVQFYYRVAQTEKFEENKTAEFIEKLLTQKTLYEKSAYLLSYIQRQWAEKNAGFTGAGQKIEAVAQYIQKHYMEDISLADIAEYVGLTENYLSNLFKTSTGENLTKYINKVRINKAINYLEHTSLKVYEIGELVGYKNTTYFSTMFKKITGQSVSDFRNGK